MGGRWGDDPGLGSQMVVEAAEAKEGAEVVDECELEEEAAVVAVAIREWHRQHEWLTTPKERAVAAQGAAEADTTIIVEGTWWNSPEGGWRLQQPTDVASAPPPKAEVRETAAMVTEAQGAAATMVDEGVCRATTTGEVAAAATAAAMALEAESSSGSSSTGGSSTGGSNKLEEAAAQEAATQEEAGSTGGSNTGHSFTDCVVGDDER